MVTGRFCSRTLTTGDAFFHINIPGILLDFDGKIPRFPGNALHFREGQKFNTRMPADLDQFGRKDSHGTVIGGKRLVQLGHEAPDGCRPFHQIDIITGIRHIQGGLHSGNTPTHHHHGANLILFHFSLSVSAAGKVFTLAEKLVQNKVLLPGQL